MQFICFLTCFTFLQLSLPSSFASEIEVQAQKQKEDLEKIFKDLHQHPELALQESRTSEGNRKR